MAGFDALRVPCNMQPGDSLNRLSDSLDRTLGLVFLAQVLLQRILERLRIDYGSGSGAFGLLLQVRAKTVQVKIALLDLGAVSQLLPMGWVSIVNTKIGSNELDVPYLVACQELPIVGLDQFGLIVVLCGVDLGYQVFLLRHRARREKWRDEVHFVKGVVEERLIEAAAQNVLLRITVTAVQLWVELKIRGWQEAHIVQIDIGKVAKIC